MQSLQTSPVLYLHSGFKAVGADCYGKTNTADLLPPTIQIRNLQYLCRHLDLSNDFGTKSVELRILFIRITRSFKETES